ncbi:MAG: SEC-C domain-containing protein [Candidatus Dadabacteria bacterium]|nr:SEC-C domain-containing protein [Candidatus Dadabacteria bacterium]
MVMQGIGSDIESRAREVAEMVSGLPPGQLLVRAHWHAVAETQDVETDLDIGREEISAIRLVEYLQSVIISVPPSATQAEAVTEDDWGRLVSMVDALFAKIEAYLFSESRKAGAGRGEWLKFLLSLQWLGSRGHNYMVHFHSHYEDTLLPYSDIFKEVYGLTGEELVDGLRRVHRATIDGLTEMQDAFERVRLAVLSSDGEIKADTTGPRELLQQLIAEAGVEEAATIVTDTWAGLRLFDVGRITRFPDQLLDDLSWSPGKDDSLYAPGDMTGWPLREWPTFSRPFIRLDDHYCCFDPYLLADRFPVALKRGVLNRRPDLANEWREIQTELTENLAVSYLCSLLPGASVQRRVFWDAEGMTWETDALISYDDHLLVVESKSGAFSPASPAVDFESHIDAARELGEGPVRQASRFIETLNATGQVDLFDSNARRTRNQIGTIVRSDYRRVSPVAATLSPFTEFAAQMLHLGDIGVGEDLAPAWVVSVNDLRLCADIFDNPLIFLHYLETRLAAASLEKLWLNDELDHLGLYLGHNDYGAYAREDAVEHDLDVVFSHGARDIVDAHFMPHPPWGHVEGPLRQEMPPRFEEMVDLLANSKEPGRAAVASYLLDSGGDLRTQFDAQIGDELERQKALRRPLPLSLYGRDREGITVVCWSPWTGQRRPDLALEHTQSVVIMGREAGRLILEVTSDAEGRLVDVHWDWIRLDSIDQSRRAYLAPYVDRLRRQRVAAASMEWSGGRPTGRAPGRRIGRNEPCPCQSGLKYKKCCLKRYGSDLGRTDPGATQAFRIGSPS